MALKSLGSYWFSPCTSLAFLFHVHVQPGVAETQNSVAPKGDCKCSTGVSPNDAGGRLLLCTSGLFGFQNAFFCSCPAALAGASGADEMWLLRAAPGSGGVGREGMLHKSWLLP